jgi:AraC-like DNA-binding protein
MSYLTTYQLSTGQQRSVCVEDPENLFKAFYGLIDFGGDVADGLIRLEVAGRHRIVFVNRDALDYVVIPTHRALRSPRAKIEEPARLIGQGIEGRARQIEVDRMNGGMRPQPGVDCRQTGPVARKACHRSYSQRTCKGGVTLSELASACGLSIRHFTRAFRGSTGVSAPGFEIIGLKRRKPC